MRLYGKDCTRREVEARVGRVEQIGGVRRLECTEGLEKGLETVHVRTGAGLDYFVNPSRGLDISLCEFNGAPLSWQAPQGDVAPEFYSDRGADWLRTACGGLLMTCGLRHVGPPVDDAGEMLGVHGRIHHAPARQGTARGAWEGEEYVMSVSGTLAEVRMFGEHLQLCRTIESRLGANSIRIHDVVENSGFESSPLMLLYHFNFGFPLLAPETAIKFPSQRVVPREADLPLAGYDRWEAPQHGYAERVYYHEALRVDGQGLARASLTNPDFPGATPGGIRVELRWKPAQLPELVQWKMCGEGMHVLGIEPANCRVGGRAVERAAGRLKVIEPGERKTFELDLIVEKA
jgi:hypothetical protein